MELQGFHSIHEASKNTESHHDEKIEVPVRNMIDDSQQDWLR